MMIPSHINHDLTLVQNRIDELLTKSINLYNFYYDEDAINEFISEDDELTPKSIADFVRMAIDEYEQYDLKEIISEIETDDIKLILVDSYSYMPVTKLFMDITIGDLTIFDYIDATIMRENYSDSEKLNLIQDLIKKINKDIEKINDVYNTYQKFEVNITDLIIENMKG